MPLRFDYELRQRPLFANGTYGKSFMEKMIEFEGRRNHHGAKQHMSTKEYLPDAYMFEIWQDIFGVGHRGQTLESLEALEPRWVREMFRNMAVFIKRDCKCDMVSSFTSYRTVIRCHDRPNERFLPLTCWSLGNFRKQSRVSGRRVACRGFACSRSAKRNGASFGFSRYQHTPRCGTCCPFCSFVLTSALPRTLTQTLTHMSQLASR